MKALTAQPKPVRPPLVVNICHWCGAMWATYAGSIPRGWAFVEDRERFPPSTPILVCKRCRP